MSSDKDQVKQQQQNRNLSTSAGLEIFSRIFNHRPFLQGEIEFFVRNFEKRREDREIENIFGILERVSELRDHGVDKLRANLSQSSHQINSNLQAAECMVDRILRASDTNEVEKTLKSSRECRETELVEFTRDIHRRYKRIDENYLLREEELITKYNVN